MSFKIRLNDIDIGCYTYTELLEEILSSASNRKKICITYINQKVFNDTYSDRQLKEYIQKFDIVHPDGTGMYHAIKFLRNGNEHFERVNGTDLYKLLLEKCGSEGYRIFYLGGMESTKEKIKDSPENYCSSGMISNEEFYKEENVIEKINNSGSDILMVGLGTPEQESFVVSNFDKLNVTVVICAGSGIDLLAGTYKRAPVFFRKLHLEWLHKLISDTKRTWKRYVIGIPVFVFKIIQLKFKNGQ